MKPVVWEESRTKSPEPSTRRVVDVIEIRSDGPEERDTRDVHRRTDRRRIFTDVDVLGELPAPLFNDKKYNLYKWSSSLVPEPFFPKSTSTCLFLRKPQAFCFITHTSGVPVCYWGCKL
jgi:hypothetical protein